MKIYHWVAALVVSLMLHSTAGAQTPLDPNNPLFAPPTKDEIFIKLVDTRGEPRGFCFDLPGFPASGVVSEYRESSWPIGVHTCKTGIPNANIAHMDQLFSASSFSGEDKQIRFTRLNICLEVAVNPRPAIPGLGGPGQPQAPSVREDAFLIANPCTKAPTQQFVIDAEGRIRSVLEASKCVTAGTQAFEAGNRAPGEPWHWRDVNVSTCSPEAAERQKWQLAPPG